MLRRTKENFLSLGVILGITLLFLYSTLHLEFFESKIMPLFIASLTLILLALAFVHEYGKIGCVTLSEDENSPADVAHHDRKMVKCLLPLFVLVALIFVFGFYVSTFVFLFAYMKVSGSALSSTVLVSSLGSAFIYGVFPLLLETPLYTGMLAHHLHLAF